VVVLIDVVYGLLDVRRVANVLLCWWMDIVVVWNWLAKYGCGNTCGICVFTSGICVLYGETLYSIICRICKLVEIRSLPIGGWYHFHN
jgi:hypothetical protein